MRGVGIGWRPELALAIDRYPGLGFVEVIAEGLDAEGLLLGGLAEIRDRGVPIVPHGVSLSLGGAEPLDRRRIDHLARLAVRLESPLVSEHIAFVRAGDRETGHLLPVPRTRDSLAVLVENVMAAQALLPAPLALENISTLLEWPRPEMDEAEFLASLLDQTGAWLLLDIANVYANARNHGWDARAYLDRMPLERVAYLHVGGGIEHNGLYHDTHAHPVPVAVLELLSYVCARCSARGLSPPGVLLERDDAFPPEAEIAAELDAITRVMNTSRT